MKIPPRLVFVFTCVVSVSLLSGAYILGEVWGIKPCYLCNFQRFMYLLLAFFSSCGIVFIRWKRLWELLLAVTAAGGAATALWQSWIQFFPDQTNGCGVGEPDLLEKTVDMLGVLWPDMFMVFGDCADDSWRFLGGSLANWSAMFFIGLLMLSLYCVVLNTRLGPHR